MAWNDGKALTADEIATTQKWFTNEAKGDTKLLSQKADEFGFNNSQRQQLGLVGQAYAGGRDLQDWEKTAAQKWATGKDANTVAQKGMEMGVTPEQFGQLFGFTGAQATAAGYGSAQGINPTMRDNMFNGREWYTPATPATPTTPASTGMVATATPTTYEAKTFDNVKQWTPTQFNNVREWSPTNAAVTNWNVTPDQLVENRTNNIIKADSPLMQMARGAAMQQGNERGLVNSSMAVGAAQDAVLRNALQIATPDAATYAGAARFNADANNTVGMFNADAANRAAMSNADSFNRVGMFNADAQNVAASSNADALNRAGMFNTEAENTAAATNAGAKNTASMFNAGQTNTFNIADRELTQKASQFDRQLTQQQEQFLANNALELKKLGIQVDLAKMDDATRMALASMNMSAASLSAGAQQSIAEANRAFQSAENKTNAFNRQWDTYTDRVLKITIDPNISPANKDSLIAGLTNDFKGWAAVNQIVGDFSFVNQPVASAPASTTTAAPATAPVYQPEVP